jgi:hypothetical protein
LEPRELLSQGDLAIHDVTAGGEEALQQAGIVGSIRNLPLSFEPNLGQSGDEVDFLARGDDYSLFLNATEAALALEQGSSAPAVLRVQIVGGDPAAEATGREERHGKSNYFVGNDPMNWHTNVPNYAKVEYQNVYPGVDLIYYGTNEHQLEFDFLLEPGGDPRVIVLSFGGPDELEIDTDGNLVLRLASGELTLRAPVAFQEINGARQIIASQFVFRGDNQVGFDVAAYDRNIR